MSLAARARRRVPSALKPTLRAGADLADPLVVRSYRRRTGYAGPIPRRTLRARVGAHNVDFYVDAGRKVAGAVGEAVARAGDDIRELGQIADWGAGSGRVLAHVDEIRGGVDGLAACDVDAEAIAWLREALPGVDARVNGFEPPLPFEADRFDLLYSISILTHLDEPAQDAWLEEIRRVVKPGGLAIVSVNGESPYRETRGGTHPAALSPGLLKRLRARGDLADEGFVFEAYDIGGGEQGQFPGITGSYGLTFQDPGRVRDRWSRWFDIVEHQDRAVSRFQDLVVMRRR
jgi:SAM-dependent methyltransferase